VSCLILTVSRSCLQLIPAMNSPNLFLWQISFKYLKLACITICPRVSLWNIELLLFLDPFTSIVSPLGWGENFIMGFVNIGTTGTWVAETWLLVPDLKGLRVRQSFWCLTTIFLSIVVVWFVLVCNWIKSGCWIKQDVVCDFNFSDVKMFNLLNLKYSIFLLFSLSVLRDNPGSKPHFLIVLFYDVFMSTVLVQYEFIC